MKKHLSKLLSVTLAGTMLCCAGVFAETIGITNDTFGITVNAKEDSPDLFVYEENSSGGITITFYWGKDGSPGVECNEGDITVPAYIEGKPVTEIANGAFMGQNTITSLTLPDTVKTIEARAFCDMPKMTSFTFPPKVTVISGNLFGDCTGLKSFTVPDQITKIEGSAFYGCSGLETVTIGKGVKSIEGFSFKGCTSLKSIYIPESVTYMGNHMFVDLNQNKLTSITIYGKKGSYAQTYAANNGIAFKEYNNVDVTKIAVNKTSKTIGVGENYNLKATISPSDATNKTVTWTTSNSAVATVSGGKVTAKKAGTAIITAKSNNGKTSSCKITVKAAPSKVTLNKTTKTIGVGEPYTLKATLPDNTASGTRTWTSNNTSVVAVKDGVLSAKKTGKATITVKTFNNKSASCVVTVLAAPSKITLNKTSKTIGLGESYKLKTTLPANTASGTMTWTSSNTSVATVKDGKITAVKAGTATITAKTFNGKTAACKITVKAAPSKVTLNKTSKTIGVGETYGLKATLPANTASGIMTWTSSNTTVATVKDGTVTALKTGSATITVSTFNGKTATCKITVKAAPTKITLDNTKLSLKAGNTATLTATIPSGTASGTRTWTTNNSAVATVKDGLVTAVKAGKATITVKTYNGKSASCIVTVTK